MDHVRLRHRPGLRQAQRAPGEESPGPVRGRDHPAGDRLHGGTAAVRGQAPGDRPQLRPGLVLSPPRRRTPGCTWKSTGWTPRASTCALCCAPGTASPRRPRDLAACAEYAYRTYGLTPVFLSLNVIYDTAAAQQVAEHLHCPYHILDDAAEPEMLISPALPHERCGVHAPPRPDLLLSVRRAPGGVSYDPKIGSLPEISGGGQLHRPERRDPGESHRRRGPGSGPPSPAGKSSKKSRWPSKPWSAGTSRRWKSCCKRNKGGSSQAPWRKPHPAAGAPSPALAARGLPPLRGGVRRPAPGGPPDERAPHQPNRPPGQHTKPTIDVFLNGTLA